MKSQKMFDARKLDRKAKEALRIQAVQKIESGESPELVASIMGLNRRTVYRWLEQYHYGGIEALKSKPIKGATPKINAKQMQQLANIIRDKNPQQMKMEFALWTISSIRTLILQKFSIKLSEVSVGRLLKRMGFTPQRPLHRAWQQDPVLVDAWKAEKYPAIVKKAKKQRGLILFADEAAIRSDHHAGRTWALKGQTPIVESTGARYSLNMISAVSTKGHFRFMTTTERVTSTVFLEFLRRLVSGMSQKIFLIVDGHPIHKAKQVVNFVNENKNAIELFYLPPYSPELNPDELVWANVKAKVGKSGVTTKHDLFSATKRALKHLSKMPEKIISFFKKPTCSYSLL